MGKQMERKINHGLNLLRIISMLGIIGLHVLNVGGRNRQLESAFSHQCRVKLFLYSLCMYCGYLCHDDRLFI